MVSAKTKKAIESLISSKKKASVILEVPSRNYFEAAVAAVKLLTDKGFSGAYISLNRPFENLRFLLNYKGVDTSKLIFIDVATSMTSEKRAKDSQCMHVSKRADYKEVSSAAHTALSKLSGKKFIYLDSLTLATFYKAPSETKKLAKLLIERIEKEHANYVLFSVAAELADKDFMKIVKKDIDKVIVIK
jgi:hypothetical protein